MKSVSKEIFLKSRSCLTWGWYLRNQEKSAVLSEADRFRMKQGAEVGKIARTLYPEGVLVPPGPREEMCKKTSEFVWDASQNEIFEATFASEDFIARADILVRSNGGWKLIEVKSSFSTSSKRKDYIDDIAYTAMVLEAEGLNVQETALLFLSRDYRKGMKADQLFEEEDVTTETRPRIQELRDRWEEISNATAAPARPEPVLVKECKKCPFFQDDCLGKGVANPVIHLPNLTAPKLEFLAENSTLDIEEIPDDMALSEGQQRIVSCVKNQSTYVGPGLTNGLNAVQWPAYYLDFETVMTTLPLYEDLPPHEQVLTQYSIHKCDVPGEAEDHFEYLADSSRECQRELAENMVRVLQGDGSIVVYSSFEKTRISGLMKRFPELKDNLEALVPRLFDLMSVIRAEFYHPAFGGSYSIKSTLPALVPDLSYENKEIQDGETASAQFARMALGQYSSDKVEQIRSALLDYCKLDTLAMVKLHANLLEKARD